MKIAGTGHRPDKIRIGAKNAYDDAVFQRVVDLCRVALPRVRATEVIAGGALGFDEALATAALDLQLPLHLYLPFPGYDARWPAASRANGEMLAERATTVRFVTTEAIIATRARLPDGTVPPLAAGEVADFLHRRNRAMVDDAGAIIALFDGQRRGGTYSCLQYADKHKRHVTNLWPSWTKHAARGLAE